MSKKIIMLLLALFVSCIATGCGNNNKYPSVYIDTARFNAVQSIDVGNNYKYVDFDVTGTDTGKDVIIHFERRTDERTD